MSEHIIRSQNKTLLLYHIVCPAKYRKAIFTEALEQSLKVKRVAYQLRAKRWIHLSGDTRQLNAVQLGIVRFVAAEGNRLRQLMC